MSNVRKINGYDVKDAVAREQIALLQNRGGSPEVANFVADMEDQTKIYVYTGSESGYVAGNWYYYDEEAWVSGGVYGADGGLSENSRNLLKYILDRVAYTETGMDAYVNALYYALAQEGSTITTYTITNALVHVTNSNSSAGINAGQSYSGTLTADTDYTIGSVTVTMGGVDITATAYDSSDDSITIASVTGDIVITASASYWDYEWYASSGVAPSFMAYASCTFAQDNSYATIHINSNTDLFVLDDVGDMEMEFAVGFPGSYNNNPQFVVRTSATGGFKVFPSTSSGVVSTNISGSTATLPVADRTALNIYKMHIVSGACSLEYGTSESSLTTLTGSGQTSSSYYPKTGVKGATQAGGYNLNLAYFRYKKL